MFASLDYHQAGANSKAGLYLSILQFVAYMRTHQLHFSQVSAAALQWLQDKYTAVDGMSGEQYRRFLADDCQLQFGNNPVVHCNNEIIGGIQHFWDSIQGLDHSFLNVFGTDENMAAEALIDYTRKDGQVVQIPCVTVIQRNDAGLASLIKIFLDTTPIFQ